MADPIEKTFEEKLADRKVLSEQTDDLDEEIATEFFIVAKPAIDLLRLMVEEMSDNTSFVARIRQVLSQIENGLLRDPLAIKVLDQIANTPTDTPSE